LEKNPKELEELRPWAILFSALLGALVSPAEITSQIVLGFCFYLLYELLLIGLWVHWINLKSKK
jgi:Sec-independent protein secretion pathway component TatC